MPSRRKEEAELGGSAVRENGRRKEGKKERTGISRSYVPSFFPSYVCVIAHFF
jgi:hypothetical protein